MYMYMYIPVPALTHILQFHNLGYEALGPYGYQWEDNKYYEIPVVHLDVLKFINGTIEPASKTAHFSKEDHWGGCLFDSCAV